MVQIYARVVNRCGTYEKTSRLFDPWVGLNDPNYFPLASFVVNVRWAPVRWTHASQNAPKLFVAGIDTCLLRGLRPRHFPKFNNLKKFDKKNLEIALQNASLSGNKVYCNYCIHNNCCSNIE